MVHAAELNAFDKRHAKFFLQLTRECSFGRFAVAYLSAGEFPF
jgi:hypothetical protein